MAGKGHTNHMRCVLVFGRNDNLDNEIKKNCGIYRKVSKVLHEELLTMFVIYKRRFIMGIPRLIFSTTSQFSEVWRDKGSGATMNGAFYRPIPPSGYKIMGDYGQRNYNKPNGTVMVFKAEHEDPNNLLLKPPEGFSQIVNDRGSDADQDGSFWYPLPPYGYVSIGSVVQRGYDEPDVEDYRCIRFDQVITGTLGGLIYADHGSGADQDMSIYRINYANVIFAHLGYDNPTELVWLPEGLKDHIGLAFHNLIEKK